MDNQQNVVAERVAALQEKAWRECRRGQWGATVLCFICFGWLLWGAQYHWAFALLGILCLFFGIWEGWMMPPVGRWGKPKFERALRQNGASDRFNADFVDEMARGSVTEVFRVVCCECVAHYGHVPRLFEPFLASELRQQVLAFDQARLRGVMTDVISPAAVAKAELAMRRQERREYLTVVGSTLCVLLLFLVASSALTANYFGVQVFTDEAGRLITCLLWVLSFSILILILVLFYMDGTSIYTLLTFDSMTGVMRRRSASADFHCRVFRVFAAGTLSVEMKHLVHVLVAKCGHLPHYMSYFLLPAVEDAEKTANQDKVATTCAEGLAKRLRV